jgi:hypothetical protein
MAKGDIKRRREVERLSASLPCISEEQRREAQQVGGTAWLGKTRGWCDVCANEFDHDMWTSRKKTMTCPKCGAKLEVKRSPNKRKMETKYYFQTITVAGEWQVVRTYLCTRNATRVERYGSEILNHADLWLNTTEVFQRWYKEGERPLIIGLALRGYHYYVDQWKWNSKWEIRKERLAYTTWGWISKKADILPVLKQRGLRRISEGSDPSKQIEAVLNDYQAEVILKAGAEKLFDKFVGRDGYKVRSLWPSIRVALRHRYKPRDVGMWLDLLQMMRDNGRDMHNPYYICPAKLKQAHDLEMAVTDRRKEKEREEKARQEAKSLAEKLSEDGKTNVAYVARVGKLLGVVVRRGDITLQPLQNVREFHEEGSQLCHCVFKNRYYEHKDCLIIGARVKGKRTETIEIDTKEWKVVQCRGKHNQPSPHHQRILNLMNKSMNKFRTAVI